MTHTQLEWSLAEYNSMMAGFNVSVKIQDNLAYPPYTMRTEVSIPAFPLKNSHNKLILDENNKVILDKEMIYATNGHELCHVMFTPFNEWEEVINSFFGENNQIVQIKKYILNAIEDARIETMFTTKYIGNEHIFMKCLMDYVLKENSKKVKNKLDHLTAYLLVIGRSYTPANIKKSLRKNAVEFSSEKDIKKMEKLVQDFVTRQFNVQKTIETVNNIYNLIIDTVTAQGEGEGEGEGEDSQNNKNSNPESENVPQMDSNELNDDSTSDTSNDNNDSTKGDSKGKNNHNKSGAKEAGNTKESINDVINDIANALKKAIETLHNGNDSCSHKDSTNDNSSRNKTNTNDILENIEFINDEGETLSEKELQKLAEQLNDAAIDAINKDINFQTMNEADNQDTKDQAELDSVGAGKEKGIVTYKNGNITDNMRNIKFTIDREFEKIISSHQDIYIPDSPSGKINIDAVMQENYDVNEAFLQWESADPDTGSIEIVFLADISSSMRSSYADLGQAIWIMQEVVNNIDNKTNFSCILFDTVPNIPPNFYDSNKYIYANNGGGTNPYTSILIAKNRLEQSPAKNKILIIMTDGEWWETSSSNKVLQEMKNKDIYIAGFLYRGTSNTFPNNVMIKENNLQGLVTLTENIVNEILQ